MKGFIKMGKHTRGHGATLKSLGYEIRETELFVEIEVSKILTATDLVDLTQNLDALTAIVKAKQGISYATPVRFKGGAIQTGIRACQGLEAVKRGLSCLVMTPVDRSPAVAESPTETGDLKSLLGV